jgi:hypothetical protein
VLLLLLLVSGPDSFPAAAAAAVFLHTYHTFTTSTTTTTAAATVALVGDPTPAALLQILPILLHQCYQHHQQVLAPFHPENFPLFHGCQPQQHYQQQQGLANLLALIHTLR